MRLCVTGSVLPSFATTAGFCLHRSSIALGLAVVLTAARSLPAQISIPRIGGENPLAEAKEKIQEDLFVKTVTKLLGDQLPINLDASKTFPTVDVLPGGPFAPQPLQFTANAMNQPLAPGDYTMNVMAFCTEYSVHRPGQGVAYKLAPLEGKQAGAVATLLWRGMQAGVPPQHLMGVAWGIQSGLTYDRMPKTFQATIDSVIPDYKSQLSGDFIQQIEDAYAAVAKDVKLPPLDLLLLKMGDAGKLALAAEVERRALLAADTTDELREQTLFAGQESGVYTPVKAEDGPWTVRIPGVAYMRYRIVGGNLHADNVIEIRILPQAANQATLPTAARLVNASFSSAGADAAAPQSPTLLALMGAQQAADNAINAAGMIGYSVGQGAQALIPTPLPSQPQPCPRDSDEVQFTRRQQVQPNWCWAAVAEMIMENANPGAELHQQCEQAQTEWQIQKKQVLAPGQVCGANGDAGFSEGVKTQWDFGFDAYDSAHINFGFSMTMESQPTDTPVLRWFQDFSPDLIKQEISCKGRLIDFTWDKPTAGVLGKLGLQFAGAHDMIIYGYDTDKASGNLLLKIYNPGIDPQSVQGTAASPGTSPSQVGNTPVQCMLSQTCTIDYSSFISPAPYNLLQVYYGASKP